MKKRYYFIFICFVILITLTLGGCLNQHEDKRKITVAEVTHSIFYTPWYVALENGYFEDENLNVEVILTPGADKVMASVLSGDAQIGFSGPEATIYIKEGNEKDYIINFAALTKRDGQFIFGPCEEKNSFNLTNLKGKEILVGRSGGMPAMVFAYALKQNKILKNDVNINTSIDFASLTGAYIGGNGDYVNLFDKSVRISKQKKKLNSSSFVCMFKFKRHRIHIFYIN